MAETTPSFSTLAASNRRQFLQTLGAAGAACATGLLRHEVQAAEFLSPERPNILLILTDQQRFPRHWPEGWAEANLPNWKRLTQNGITFSRAYCNSSMCSPSRASLFTGLYPEQHGVKDTLADQDAYPDNDLPLDIPTMGKMLQRAGYKVIYKGKWHMSRGKEQFDPTPEEIANYGFDGWTPPEVGQDDAAENFGARHDARIVDEAIEFLSQQTKDNPQPFALIVSVVNPHDVICYPSEYEADYPNAGSKDWGITIPPTINEDLSTKPTVQQALPKSIAVRLGPLATPAQRKAYVNFYAELQVKIDLELERLMAAFQDGVLEKTVIVRTADHGEMGLSHGGIRQKMFNAYEETVNVPIIVSNPVLFPQPVKTDSLAALVDLMPTLAALAQVPNRESYTFRGKDLTPIFADPSRSVQDTVLFTFDDQRVGTSQSDDPMPQPNHIQAVIQRDWKYARYWNPKDPAMVEYEMYDLKNDPTEIKNLAGDPDFETDEIRLRALLDETVAERLAPLEAGVREWGME